MSLEKLHEIYNNIDNFEKLSISLDGKISRTDDEKAEEEAVQHLMNFELSKISTYLEKLRKEVTKLELEHERSSQSYQNWHKLHNELLRNQKSIAILKEIGETSKNKRQRTFRKMGFSQDDRDDYYR